ncbi:MAG: hypothetical protein ACOC33_00405 [bacterium]
MNLYLYEVLKKQQEKKNYFEKNKSLHNWLNWFSYFGNACSVFLAYFLMNKILNEAIGIESNFAIIGAAIISILFLSFYEYIKRIVGGNISEEFIKSGYKIKNSGVLIDLLLSLLILLGSFYFSLNGAKIFVSKFDNIKDQSKIELIVLEDSIRNQYDDEKEILNEEILSLRKTNKNLLEKINNTSNVYAIQNYNRQIDNNNDKIDVNNIQINKVDSLINIQIGEVKEELTSNLNEKLKANDYYILIIIIISSIVELVIVLGVFYDKKYYFKSYLDAKNEYEPKLEKKLEYEKIIDVIYKGGHLKIDDIIMGINSIIDILNGKGINKSKKQIENILYELESENCLYKKGTRRYIKKTYSETKKLLYKLIN